jgi:predicted neuraminidase
MKRVLLMMLVLGLFFSAQVARADWTPAQRLTWNSGESYYPTIAVDFASNVHVVWNDSTPGNNEIYYVKSTDGGVTWTSGKRLSWTAGESKCPVVAADISGNIHVFWEDDTPGNREIYYKKSTDGGVTWTSSKRLSWTAGQSLEFSESGVAADSLGKLHVVWEDNTAVNTEIFYKRSTDGGANWTKNKRLTWTSSFSRWPDIAVDSSGNLHVFWTDYTPGNGEVYYKKSTDGGNTWTSAQNLSWNSGNSWAATMALDSSDNLHLFWSDNTPGNYEIYYRKSMDGGATWTTRRRLTWTSGLSWDPKIVIDSFDYLHMVWADDTRWDWDIYYKKSLDEGATWTIGQRLTLSESDSCNSEIAVDSSANLHVVWNDNAPGNAEIYYRKFVK